MKNTPAVSPTVYYSLIIAQFILPIIAACIDMFNVEPELELLDKTLYLEPQSWELTVMGIAGIIILTITIGLLLKKEWARKAYLYTFFPTFLLYFMPYMHWIYMSSFAAIFNDLAFVSAGILLMILVTPSLYQPIFQE
ncbi:hypothetical protein BEN71_18895 [Acinetobacter wuhouensis]|uniref:Uncharacterized protein n=1 Tax=Acinetobacter wuhouensis TaxID=1879050 RepID=A0A385C8E2_9GAMM|nr:hypothetical protein [Acinetobacter wuhouensis]AXQ23987.1 hypothetical protein BEN71_18895 [Acinetobacter wuhouensis]AYO56170.1 hypothetical protein CDG68_22185 [Acinetobacter wuhouensis]RZG71370.1 hypothetical protein EXU29_14025 [Acinetobacter wuhouensis]